METATKLAVYLRERGIVCREFARDMGVSPQSMHRYVSAERLPRDLDLWFRIVRATRRRVTIEDMVRDRLTAERLRLAGDKGES